MHQSFIKQYGNKAFGMFKALHQRLLGFFMCIFHTEQAAGLYVVLATDW